MPLRLVNTRNSFAFLGLSIFCFLLYVYHYERSKPASFAPLDASLHHDEDEPSDGGPSTNFTDLKTLSSSSLRRGVYNPYPNYNSKTWRRNWKGLHHACVGPRGLELQKNANDMLIANSIDSSLTIPEPLFGSYYESGLDSRYCFDRQGRLGPYGFQDQTLSRNSNLSEVNWSEVNWGELQANCFERNKDRYTDSKQRRAVRFHGPSEKENVHDLGGPLIDKSLPFPSRGRRAKPRTAILLRTNDDHQITANHAQNLRAMITEVSLHSGGEYSVYILNEIRDKNLDLLGNSDVYQDTLEKSNIPVEFHNITLIWNEPLLEVWYPKVEQKHGQSWHFEEPLQVFSLMHPEFDYLWQMEMDVRFTGHW